MHACLKCGKRTSGDYLVWKGGVNRAVCDSCRREEQENETGNRESRSDKFSNSFSQGKG